MNAVAAIIQVPKEKKKICGREPQSAWRQEMIGGKLPKIK
jgi:hypothetical protein